MTILIVIWAAMAMSTIIVGNRLAYRKQVETWNSLQESWCLRVLRPTPARFILRQIIAGLRHPKVAFGIIGGCVIMPPLMLLAILIDTGMFDLAEVAYEEEEQKMRDAFREMYNMEWRVICHADAVECQARKLQYLEDQYGAADLCERLGLVTGKAVSFATLLLGLLFAPFAMFVPKASAQTKSGQMTESVLDPHETPFDPGINGMHGAISAGWTLVVQTNEQADPTLVWQLRQMDLRVLPRVSREVSATVVLGFAKLVSGHTDPVLVASMNWKLSDEFELKGGRILNPTGLSRQLPPHLLTELAYVNTGTVLAPFFEHGLVGQWRPSNSLELGLGVLSGHGTGLESDGKPDMVLLARIRPTPPLTLGLDAQTGPQPDGWRHVVGSHARLDLGSFYGQAEVIAALSAEQDRTTVCWYILGVFRSITLLEPYLRVESLHNDPTRGEPITLIGANYRPRLGVTLRGASSVTLSRTPTIGLQLAVQTEF